MNSELVELVVQLYEKNWGVKDYGLARAVVAMCMEEAAKVADSLAAGENTTIEQVFQSMMADHIAAAIRALKDAE